MQDINSLSDDSNPIQDHIKTLEGVAAVKKLRELATGAENCFFCTNIKTGLPVSVRPMSVQQVDEEGNLWFISNLDSNKNKEIKLDPFTQLFFQENKNSGFLSVYGLTEIVQNDEKLKELWSPLLKVWFPDGKEDPQICLLKVIPTNVYYWDTKNSEAIAFIKMAASILTGKTMDDSVEGKLEI